MFQQSLPVLPTGLREIPPPRPGATVGVNAPLQHVQPRLVRVTENDQRDAPFPKDLLRRPHQMVAEPPADPLTGLQKVGLRRGRAARAAEATDPGPETPEGPKEACGDPRLSANTNCVCLRHYV